MAESSFSEESLSEEDDLMERSAPPIELSPTDLKILDRLEEDGRESVTKIAEELEISASLVRRRMASLKERGVISKYTVVVDHWKIGRRIEAYLLLRINIKGDLKALRCKIRKVEGVREVATLAGNEDVLVRLRVSDPAELTDTVLAIRQMEGVMETKTLVSLGRDRHLSKKPKQADAERDTTDADPGDDVSFSGGGRN